MTGELTHMQQPFTVAHGIHLVLSLEQLYGTIPQGATLRVLIFDRSRLVVAIGGLEDEFLVGPGTPTLSEDTALQPRHLTLEAKAVHDAGWHAVHALSPHKPHGGGLVHPTQVWMLPRMQSVLTDARWPHGVVHLDGGETP
ncbi:hypothetical protein [Actinokineospora terrae]|uniref:Uncharacterized protein n=1 Tax=Actinokineospora terrae TaxID=155974 RepID=A0A1H9XSU1_9PSEU|nr:hypothetical protein [Actinokineospora terrae]SES49119.1 hypothetical protein SAMN04487818_12433 [Actinokineospora terrae]